MSRDESVQFHRAALSRLAAFVDEFKPVVNVCMVDFITEDIFADALTADLQAELMAMTETELCGLPGKLAQNMTDDEDTETTTPVIDGLVKRIREHFLESLDVLTAKETFLVEDNGDNRSRLNILEHLDRIMADKKMHEVVVLARALQNIAGRAIQVSSSSNDEPF